MKEQQIKTALNDLLKCDIETTPRQEATLKAISNIRIFKIIGGGFDE